jgi:hypothetical protein
MVRFLRGSAQPEIKAADPPRSGWWADLRGSL